MSGHSKWHNIMQRKGKQDAKRSNAFTKLGKALTVAAKEGGGDPVVNFSLRLAVEKAKAAGMPKDTIEKAIKRGTGELKDGAVIEAITYEGYGPGGVAILITTATDNKNRTVSDLKHILSKNGGSLGSAGSVQYLFEQLGVVEIRNEKIENKEEFEIEIIDAGADDISADGDNMEIKTKAGDLKKVLEKLKELNIEVAGSGLYWIPKDKIQVNKDVESKLGDLFEALEENDDVEDYFTNAG